MAWDILGVVMGVVFTLLGLLALLQKPRGRSGETRKGLGGLTCGLLLTANSGRRMAWPETVTTTLDSIGAVCLLAVFAWWCSDKLRSFKARTRRS